MKINKFIELLSFCLLIFFIINPAVLDAAETVIIPGRLDALTMYLQNYSLNSNNFLYHLNEIFLWNHLPTYAETAEFVMRKSPRPKLGSTIRRFPKEEIASIHQNVLNSSFYYRFKRLLQNHDAVKKSLQKETGKTLGTVSFDLNQPDQKQTAIRMAEQTGLEIQSTPSGFCRMVEYSKPPHYRINHYFLMSGFDPWNMAKNINRHRKLEMTISEFKAKLPWSFDFLHRITNLTLTPENFAETLSTNKKLQLLLGILYRLSNREIEYINRLEKNGAADLDAWKRIYNNEKFLCGMFVLSHGLRAKDNRLLLPGGTNAVDTWNALAGTDYHRNPLQFLEALATKDGGKLNYFYLFTYFLPADIRNTVFDDFNPALIDNIRELYRQVKLEGGERIKGLNIPGLKDRGFFTLLYALRTRNGRLYFPGGPEIWFTVMGYKKNVSGIPSKRMPLLLLTHLLAAPGKQHLPERFVSFYTRFYHRPELLTTQSLDTLFENYYDYNVMVDFIEKTPIKKPATIKKLFFWAKSFRNAGKSPKEKRAVTAISQSLLEFIANMAPRRPDKYDYDHLMEGLTKLPLTGADAYDGFFRYIKQYLKIDTNPMQVDRSFFTFLAPSSPQDWMKIREQAYKLEGAEIIKKETASILEKQFMCRLSVFVNINRLLEQITDPSASHLTAADIDHISTRLWEEFPTLPLPEINDNVPFDIKDYIAPYSTAKLFKLLKRIIKKRRTITNGKTGKREPDFQDVKILADTIKSRWLLTELKNFLVTCAYAINIKSAEPQLFTAINLTRFHDFSYTGNKTPWNHCHNSMKIARRTVYHLEGGLSRLNILLATPLSQYIFTRKIGTDVPMRTAVVYNHLAQYPYGGNDTAQQYIGRMMSLAEDILETVRKNPQNNPELKQAVDETLARITSGYHYRNSINLLDGKAPPAPEKSSYTDKPGGFPLYYNEAMKLAETLVQNKQWKKQWNDAYIKLQKPENSDNPTHRFSTQEEIREDLDRVGSIYCHTFGALKPKRLDLFPQPLSLLFKSRWTGAEMLDEYKIKTAYISYLKKFPPRLMGILAYRYLSMAGNFYSQNYNNDYDKVYYLYNIYSYLYLHSIYNGLRESGILRIK